MPSNTCDAESIVRLRHRGTRFQGREEEDPVAVCVPTNGNEDGRWVLDNAAQVTIAKIANAVYDHYAADGGK